MPEYVIQEGVSRAWEFAQANVREIVGHLLRGVSLERQIAFREMILADNPVVAFQNQSARPVLPSFTISLLGDSETQEGQWLDQGGYDYREVPHPSIDQEDFEEFADEPMMGLVYDPEKDCVVPISVGGKVLGAERNISPTGVKNMDTQRHYGKMEQENIGIPARLYNANDQRLSMQSVGDEVLVGIMVTTGSLEKTWVYYRILRWVLRRFVGWFERNGVQRPSYSGADLQSAEDLLPTSAGSPVFRRQLTVRFFHEDSAIDVETILRKWQMEVGMTTCRQDGTLDYTLISTDGTGDE